MTSTRATTEQVADEPISDEQWEMYFQQGFLHLGPVVDAAGLERLRTRVDDLALGRVRNPAVQLQLDTGGNYEELPEASSEIGTGTLRYRKVQGLETDDLFGGVLTRPVFRQIVDHHYGRHASATLFRAMVMNKPAQQGTVLPWHQDGGDVWALDRDPLITIWIALDDATAANGCVEVIPGSHRLGLLTDQGSTLSDADAARHCPAEQVHPLEVPAGHAVLLHNWLIHRSGVNPTDQPRRAFTACYLDSRTRNTLTGEHFPLIFGTSCGTAHPYLDQVRADLAGRSETARAAEEYALSLRADNDRLQESLRSATEYARSLETELAAARAQAARRPDGRSAAVLRQVAERLPQRGRVLLGSLRSKLH
ncbi:MAG TPA: phytanoyl-CoA dioxygenase family protein [Jatrophihabitans sp.]|nr:phytanoyl-CoA dioxygenase family protein [Jatrophihabitans sp.]